MKATVMSLLLGLSLTLSAQTAYDQLVRSAITAMEADSLAHAEHLLREALHTDPTAQGNAILWGHLAAIAERTGREHEALEDYGIALNLSPQTPALLLGRASLYVKLGNDERALTDYSALLENWPDHPEALLMRAYVRLRRHQLQEARSDYEHLLRLHSDHEQALLGLALVNDADLRPREAMENVSRAVEVYPEHAAGYALRAGMELARKQYELAEADYDDAIRRAPEDPTYRLARARLYMETGRKRQAREEAREAARLGASAEEVAGATAP